MSRWKIFIFFLALAFVSKVSFASEVDVLLKKLVEKGILTASEAQEVKTETNEEIAKTEKQKQQDYKTLAKDSLPDWVKNTKLKGDFRVRYQYDHAKNLDSSVPKDRQRARIRIRLGMESQINDKLLVALGLATGTNNGTVTSLDASRSPNQTLGEGWAKKAVSWNYGYAQYTPAPWVTFFGGRFNNPLWEPDELVWDKDINPEGGAIKLSKKLTSHTEGFLNAGVLVIDEGSSNAANPTMFAIQPGINQQITDNISLKGAVSYYGFSGIKGKKLDGAAGTNSGYTLSGSTVSGTLLYNYENIVPAIELSIKKPFQAIGVDLPYLDLFGSYIVDINPNVPSDNTGYFLGCKVGNEKIEKLADWQARYIYSMVGKDAMLDILPDSDRYGGKTGIRSHMLKFDFGLSKNTWLSFAYYNAWQIPGNFGQSQSKPTDVAQVDWNIKW